MESKSSSQQLRIITIPEGQMHLFSVLRVMLVTFLLLLFSCARFCITFAF